MQDITSKLSRYVADLKYEHLPDSVIEQTKLFIADYYAACFAGYRINKPLNDVMLPLLLEMGGKSESTVLFSKEKLPAANAAFMNTVYAHGADMDDGNRKSAGHIGAHVMSAVFALAEVLNSTWGEVITAIVAGYDVFNRVAGAAQPDLYNKGFHSTGVGGSLACAAACAKLLNLDHEGVYNAISLSAIQSSGLIIIDESGQCCKPINPANGARTGLLSAKLAQAGLVSSRNPLESKKGWFNAFGNEIDEETLFDGLGETFTISESYLKLYPACRHTHCCIDGALELRSRLLKEGVELSDIEKITITIYPSAIKSAGNILYPKNADEAKFSIHYAVAVALSKGAFGLEELDVASCQSVNEFVPKIELVPDASFENRKEGIRGAKLHIGTSKGEFEETVLIPKGEAKKPLLWDDIEVKLRQCVGDLCDIDLQKAAIDTLKKTEPQAQFSMLFK
ncbi:MAG: MmgE/PrpD family protein [Clostridia bacterium]|nr:MmgE/PrpD family protein [Clostridia bacterium]